jgi:hypothetical protein
MTMHTGTPGRFPWSEKLKGQGWTMNKDNVIPIRKPETFDGVIIIYIKGGIALYHVHNS